MGLYGVAAGAAAAAVAVAGGALLSCDEEEAVALVPDCEGTGSLLEDDAMLFVRGCGEEDASFPVTWMMDPSFRERMRVDCTPGREIRWERRFETC